jgi:hypothetical protein
MLGKRKDARTTTGLSQQPTVLSVDAPGKDAAGENGLAREQPEQTREPLTLGTMCVCGHARREHRGLRMQATGPCLECDCEQFARENEPAGSDEPEAAESDEAAESEEQLLDRIRAALERVERMQETIARMRGEEKRKRTA